MRILSVVGNRPQLLASDPLSQALRERGVDEVLVHMGPPIDPELELPPPAYRLETESGTHGEETGYLLPAIEAALLEERPGCRRGPRGHQLDACGRARGREAPRPRSARRRGPALL